jgi:hypothetical protein
MSTKGIAARLRGNKPAPHKPFVPSDKNNGNDTHTPHINLKVGSDAHGDLTAVNEESTQKPTVVRGAWANGIDSIRKAASLPTPPPPVKRVAPVAVIASVVVDSLDMTSDEEDYDAIW